MDEIKTEVLQVTPTVAKIWLGVNRKNRNIRKLVVDGYARDMAAGKWQLTGEAVKFNKVGDLLDGQHRLHAIVQSGATVDMLVVHNIEDSAQAVLDSGAKRTAYDALHLDGYTNGTTLAAAARLCMTIDNGGTDTKNRTQSKSFTHSEIQDYVRSHPELSEGARAGNTYKKTIDLTPSVIAVAYARLSQIDEDDTRVFFDSLANVSVGGPGDPRNTLVKRLSLARRNGERLPQAVQLAFVYRAWNAWRKHEKLSILRTGQNGTQMVQPI